jgi:hypothetical protein
LQNGEEIPCDERRSEEECQREEGSEDPEGHDDELLRGSLVDPAKNLHIQDTAKRETGV